mmetsp:Transcript_20828/g.58720  ORF Transcript_20828/g.58720 Transcript_20828/m.58720 type:complete len:361 (+) Transcript_20828:1267-2349(+)
MRRDPSSGTGGGESTGAIEGSRTTSPARAAAGAATSTAAGADAGRRAGQPPAAGPPRPSRGTPRRIRTARTRPRGLQVGQCRRGTPTAWAPTRACRGALRERQTAWGRPSQGRPPGCRPWATDLRPGIRPDRRDSLRDRGATASLPASLRRLQACGPLPGSRRQVRHPGSARQCPVVLLVLSHCRLTRLQPLLPTTRSTHWLKMHYEHCRRTCSRKSWARAKSQARIRQLCSWAEFARSSSVRRTGTAPLMAAAVARRRATRAAKARRHQAPGTHSPPSPPVPSCYRGRPGRPSPCPCRQGRRRGQHRQRRPERLLAAPGQRRQGAHGAIQWAVAGAIRCPGATRRSWPFTRHRSTCRQT